MVASWHPSTGSSLDNNSRHDSRSPTGVCSVDHWTQCMPGSALQLPCCGRSCRWRFGCDTCCECCGSDDSVRSVWRDIRLATQCSTSIRDPWIVRRAWLWSKMEYSNDSLLRKARVCGGLNGCGHDSLRSRQMVLYAQILANDSEEVNRTG